METTPTENSNTSTNIRQTTTSPCICKVCGDSARYSYYGAIVCRSCKIFFRRNARTQKAPFKCHYNNDCTIDINTRRTCSSCRLAKCFASGMSAELIRSHQTKQTDKIKQKKKRTAIMSQQQTNEPPQLPTLNLLRADQSNLDVDQWNQLSNLVHCFDEYCGLPFIYNFIREQNILPPKLRYKYEAVNEFFKMMMAKVQLVFEKNRDISSLSLNDRRILLRNTVEYTTSIGGAFLLQQTHLLDHPIFAESAELIFRPSTVVLIKRLIDQIDIDITFVKILFAVIAFILSNYTVYTCSPSTTMTDINTIVRIQDTYIELVWRYLLYKYNDQDAVLCFSKFMRCLLLVSDSVAEAHEARQFTEIIDSVVETTEQKMILNSS